VYVSIASPPKRKTGIITMDRVSRTRRFVFIGFSFADPESERTSADEVLRNTSES
jgi:hypothetical protein